MSELQRKDLQEALLDADSSEDLPGTQAAILKAEQKRPKLRIVSAA